MLAMAYAASHPSRVDRLILISSGGPTLEFASWFEDNIRARMRPEDLEAERYWTDAAQRGVGADKVALETARALTPAYFYDRAKGLAFAAAMPDGSLHAAPGDRLFADLAVTYDVRAGLRALDRPTLIVHGHQDPIGDKTAEDIHALIRSSTLAYLDKCGHFPWLEQPEAFRQAIDEFLSAKALD
jgi:proline iminopeptidase